MAYQIGYQLEVFWVPDGAGPMTQPIGSTKKFVQAQFQPVPGGDAPTAANFNTAITGVMTTDLEAQVLASLAQLQGFATGGS